MGNPIGKWHEEHMYFLRLLGLLRHEVDALAAGATPNYGLMLNVIGYLRDYSDRMHHPREDAVFAILAARSPQHRQAIDRLRQEHRVIERHGENLRTLLEEAAADALVLRAEIEVAAATYLVYYGNHLAKEEEDVLPLAAKYLTPEDWESVKNAVPQGDPLIAADAQRYRELRRRIALEA